jgi:2-polyprenyl-3-methyl-5-hydroxy-6-metoxy-1,4-benzoquinol methylase
MSFFTERKSFIIERCSICKFMAVKNVPHDLSPYYEAGYFTGDPKLDGYMNYDFDKEVTKQRFLKDLDMVAKHVESLQYPVRLFEVGCATGFFLSLAKERGWEVEGIDLSDYAVKQAQERGLKVVAASLDSFETERFADVVVMYDVIEHVKDPVVTLKKTFSMLNKNGVVMITTPDAGSAWARMWGKKWHAIVPPQHLFYFTRKNLVKLVESSGFKVVYNSHHGKRFAVPYIIRLLYSWTGVGFFSKLAEWSGRSFLKKIAFPINVRDTIFLIAKKTSND